MTNLVPEQRADKNGKIVTRHVKAESGSSDIRTFPVPVSAPVADQTANSMEELRNSLTMKIMNATIDYENLEEDYYGDGGIRSDGIYIVLSDYSDLTLMEIDALSEEEPYDRFRTVARLINQEEGDVFISNFIGFGDVEDDSDFLERNIALVRSLASYPQFAQYEGNLMRAEPEVKEGVRALLKVSGVINDMIDDGEIEEGGVMEMVDHPVTDIHTIPVIRDAALVDYIMDQHEHADDIARVIKDRKVFDPQFIQEVISHPEQALSSGKL